MAGWAIATIRFDVNANPRILRFPLSTPAPGTPVYAANMHKQPIFIH